MGEDSKPLCIGENGPMSPEDCARWLDAKYSRHRELEDQASAQMIRNQAAEIERLCAVALAAKSLASACEDHGYRCEVPEHRLVALESALEAAGYGMSEEEFERGVAEESKDAS